MKSQINTYGIPSAILDDIVARAGVGIETAQHISTGCYADIYLLIFENAAQCILKHFRFPGIAEHEFRSYDILQRSNVFPLAKLYLFNPSCNYICMEYLKGQPLSRVSAPNLSLASQVVDLLIHCHQCRREAAPAEAAAHWENMYRMRQREILNRSALLVGREQLEREVYQLFASSVSALPQVMGNSVQHLSLLHGDYTPWNIMVDCDEKHVTGVLDPYLADFGDSEHDLIMLNKANGMQLNLVALYQQKIPSSTQFERKSVYYNAWNELCHFFYSDCKQTMNIAERAYELKQVI